MTDDDLRGLIKLARQIAAKVGPQHSAWDVIFDGEAILAGKRSIMTRDEVETHLAKLVRDSL